MATPTLSQKITPFLWFDSNAEEVAKFYTSVFKNSRITATSRYSEAGREHHGRPPGSVMTVEFDLDGQRFTALNGGPGINFNQSVSFVIHCQDQAEIDEYWSKLTSHGGEPVACGWLKDRFGVSWQVVPANIFELINGPNSGRVMQALMQMMKLDMATLQAAATGR